MTRTRLLLAAWLLLASAPAASAGYFSNMASQFGYAGGTYGVGGAGGYQSIGATIGSAGRFSGGSVNGVGPNGDSGHH